MVLGIETSCDDTGVGLVSADGRVLGWALAGQEALHGPWGGVVPVLAAQAHARALSTCVLRVLRQARVQPAQLAAVAVTTGPGLAVCLAEGVRTAQLLADSLRLPLLRMHHMEAHALAARLPCSGLAALERREGVASGVGVEETSTVEAKGSPSRLPSFPYLCLLVSGGHNLLVVVEGLGRYVQLGTTLDDALGEAYDKVARLLGLGEEEDEKGGIEAEEEEDENGAEAEEEEDARGIEAEDRDARNVEAEEMGSRGIEAVKIGAPALSSPLPSNPLPTTGSRTPLHGVGGALVEAAAELGCASTYPLPEPMRTSAHCDFSFAGLKTAVRTRAEQLRSQSGRLSQSQRRDLAASFQLAAVAHVCSRARRALRWTRASHPEARSLVLAGGVARNRALREAVGALAAAEGFELAVPPPELCSDNGVMVAWAGCEYLCREGGPGAALGKREERSEATKAPNSLEELGEMLSACAADPGARVDVRPRWPLTDRKDERRAHAPRSAKKERVFRSLEALLADGAGEDALGGKSGASDAPSWSAL